VRFGGWPLPTQREGETTLSDSPTESGGHVRVPSRPNGRSVYMVSGFLATLRVMANRSEAVGLASVPVDGRTPAPT
jgi:hypothetical protein